MRERGTMKTTRERPMECPVCLAKIRGARSTLAACRPMCGRCNVAFVWRAAEDAFAVLDGRELEANAAVVAAEAGHDRALARDEKTRVGRTWRKNTVGHCGSCRKPITATNEVCGKCGFHNDLRGRRNHGGFSDGMPF